MSVKHFGMRQGSIKFTAEDYPWQGDSVRGIGWNFVHQTHTWRPPTDVLETDESFVVVVELAGMRGVEISVSYEQQTLTINGSRSDKNVRKTYHQIEIDYGEFAGSVQIPAPVDVDHIEATYADGFLRINLPKASPKSVSIDE